jgi:hypothetical protein
MATHARAYMPKIQMSVGSFHIASRSRQSCMFRCTILSVALMCLCKYIHLVQKGAKFGIKIATSDVGAVIRGSGTQVSMYGHLLP